MLPCIDISVSVMVSLFAYFVAVTMVFVSAINTIMIMVVMICQVQLSVLFFLLSRHGYEHF